VRKAEKATARARIEAFAEKGTRGNRRDVCTTGASTIAAIESAREAGMNVVQLLHCRAAGATGAAVEAAPAAPFCSFHSQRSPREHVHQLG